MDGPLDARIEQLLRDLAPQVLGTVARRFRDFGASEDAVQEALIAAAAQWPREGLPENPRAWLTHVAARRITDQVRAEAARRRREELVVSLIPPEEQLVLPDEQGERDDTLLLLFMCCHPALSAASAIALTLRAVGGLTTAEIAKAFLVPEATMAQRISRAKQTLHGSDARFELPSAEERTARLASVAHVLYLMFNEGYAASFGSELRRSDLSAEAIRLTRMLFAQVPEDPEVEALLALMLLTDARRAARTGPTGELIPLDEQDRTLWSKAEIAEGVARVTSALAKGTVGPYQVQAAIAAVHDEATSTDTTDWAQLLALYEMLERMSDNPMVTLNRAIAVAMVHGSAAGLEVLAPLEKDSRLSGTHRLDAVKGHLFERMGERERAIASYERAIAKTASEPERNYLLLKAARLRNEKTPR